jgi:hypothetical protein
MNIHHFDTIENFSSGRGLTNNGEFETDVSRENHKKVQIINSRKSRTNLLKKKKKSAVFKINLNKGNFEENDKLIKSFTQNDNDLKESLNEISGMDLSSPNIYATNQDEDKDEKSIVNKSRNEYRTNNEDSMENRKLVDSGIMPKPIIKPTRRKVISKKKPNKRSNAPLNISVLKHEDEEAKAKEVDKMLNQNLKLEKPDKSLKFVLLSWEKYFYEHICEMKDPYEEEEKKLIKILAGDWRKKFNKKGIIFFFFIIEWCAYVKSTLVVKSISWSKIPGYAVTLIRLLKTTSLMS